MRRDYVIWDFEETIVIVNRKKFKEENIHLRYFISNYSGNNASDYKPKIS